MPGDLLHYLARLIRDDQNDGMSAGLIADVLWMARHLQASGRDEAAGPSSLEPFPGAPVTHPQPEEPVGHPPVPEGPAAPEPPPDRPIEFHPIPAPRRAAGPDIRTAAAVRVPAVSALPDELGISRALRPLKRRVPMRNRVTLAEEATSAAFGETMLILPVWQPATERWLQVDLVVDTSASMAIWQRTAAEFQTLMEHHGAFRNVRTWAINSDQPVQRIVPFAKRQASQAGIPHSAAELVDPGGRRAVLILTDAVGDAWHNGALAAYLATWAQSCPLAIVQMLPRRLWHRTALDTTLVTAHMKPAARSPFRVNRAHDSWTGQGRDPRGPAGWIPVLQASGDWLRPWAAMVGGAAEQRADLYAVPLLDAAGPAPRAVSATGLSAAQRVHRFRNDDPSAEAAELAGYLAAAPLSLPVMRLVQHAMLPGSGPEHLAEVFLSGLLVRTDPSAPDDDPDAVLYEFRDGVREQLLAGITRPESLRVLEVLSRVSGRVAERFGGTLDFRALVPDPGRGGTRTLPAESLPFARVAATVLSGLGGVYGDLARSLTEAADGEHNAPPGAASIAHPTVTEDDLLPQGVPDGMAAPTQGDYPPTAEEPGASRDQPPAAPRPTRLPVYPESWPSASAPLPQGKIYQPLLFVGLGGTGCDIGAELERALRRDICGPDGRNFLRLRKGPGLLPYQLPSCVQFVYADMNQAELDRLPRRVVPGGENEAAVAHTAHYVRDLVPHLSSYPELARYLRLEAGRVTDTWLPPEHGEPRVKAMQRGAGQFPTVGRAALFGMLAHGLSPAVRDIRNAIGSLATSGEDLYALSGRLTRSVDVFVAFSVAGGTGCGVFYDYLHLIGEMFQQSQLRARIYPLVLMPSAFDSGTGGGRAAGLNAGRALLDLFRLVDRQNGADAERELRSPQDRKPIDPEQVAVDYPQNQRIVLRPGTVQTAILFSRPAGATREDMHRSIVSLVTSLAGAGVSEEKGQSDPGRGSFADSFANEAAHRQVRADNGIGNRGASTALVASLTVPVDDIASIVSARLLRSAIEQLSVPASPAGPDLADVEAFLVKAGIRPVLAQTGNDFAEPAGVSYGAQQVVAALNRRREAMQGGIAALRSRLALDVPQLAQSFGPAASARALLGRMDVFSVQRVISGDPAPSRGAWPAGAAEVLRRRREAPPVPNGFGAAPPPVPELMDRLFRRVSWRDEAPIAARAQQDDWYRWATQVAWAEAWDASTPIWRPALERVQAELNALTEALTEFARHDHHEFDRRSADLYRSRVSVSYLLPPGTGRMEQFYDQVVSQLIEHGQREGLLQAHPREADLMQAMAGAQSWPEAYLLSVEQDPGRAVAYLLEQLKTGVKNFLLAQPPGQRPMLPRLAELLAEAAGRGVGTGVMPEVLDEFRGKLAGLLPANFIPQGSGPLKILIFYPAPAGTDTIERYLRSALLLPDRPAVSTEFRHAHTDSISIVLFRTAMGLTDVPEVRDVLRLCADAANHPQPADLLRWRQRTGYDAGYLATREEDRRYILHRLLCALWNGKASVVGDELSPERISVQLDGGVSMSLPLSPLGQASSWGSLLRAYELWALDDDDIHRRFCAQLMRELPSGLESRPDLPADLYLVVRDLAEGQIECLDDMIKQQAAAQRSRAVQMRSFWAATLPAALDLEFTGLESPIAPSLRALEAAG